MYSNKYIVFAAILVVSVAIVHGNATLITSDFDGNNLSLAKANSADRGDPKNFPYIAHIEYPNLPHAKYCIGAIIDKFWVLTTAGCAKFITVPNRNTVIVGIGLKNNQNGVRYDVDRVIENEDFPNGTRFLLVKTRKAIKMNKRVNVIKLNQNDIKGDKRVLIARWKLENPKRLSYRNAKTLTNKKCRAAVVDNHKDYIIPAIVCTWGNLNRHKDEGTALIDAKNRTLIGLSSLIFAGNDGRYPDLYLRVQSDIKWIKSVIKSQ